jgi:hypothetical protein
MAMPIFHRSRSFGNKPHPISLAMLSPTQML